MPSSRVSGLHSHSDKLGNLHTGLPVIACAAHTSSSEQSGLDGSQGSPMPFCFLHRPPLKAEHSRPAKQTVRPPSAANPHSADVDRSGSHVRVVVLHHNCWAQRGAGVSTSKVTTNGAAAFRVRPRTAGRVTVTVADLPNMLGCRTTKKVAKAPRKPRKAVAGTTGGAALTGRVR